MNYIECFFLSTTLSPKHEFTIEQNTISNHSAFALRRFMPLGDTDSERAFCALLERLCSIWMAKSRLPDLADRYRVVAAFARQIRELGPANFVYCDGDTMFVHADRRRQAG